MSANRSGLVKAMLALSLMLIVAGFVVIKSGAIESHVENRTINGKTVERKTTRFNAGKIQAYLSSVVAPITGSKALNAD